MHRILLVEDEKVNQEMLQRRLRRKGFDVLLAADGHEAIQQAKTQLPDLILMDLRLPELDGCEATRRIKADTTTAHIPVIAVTADAMPEDRRKATEAGCDDYDTKPIDFVRLLQKIHVHLEKGASQSD